MCILCCVILLEYVSVGDSFMCLVPVYGGNSVPIPVPV